jgi:Tol biopolymer transport system component
MQFVVRRARTLLAVLVLASAAVVVTAPPASATSPGYNGRIAFTRDDGYGVDTTGIYTINPDGTGLQQLTHGWGVFASYNADGSQIAYARAPGIHVMNADGGSDQTVLSQANTFGLSWSPDSSKFMWMANVDTRSVISVENADGSNSHQLLSDDLGSRYYPTWSPDGNRIAFWNDASRYVGIVDADGSNERQVTVAAAAAGPNFVSFSPDGTKLAYTQHVYLAGGSPSVVHIVNVDGTHDHAVGDTTGNSGNPVWSPDGRWLAFLRSGSRAVTGLWVSRSDGTNAHRLTDRSELLPVWQSLPSRTNLPPRAIPAVQSTQPLVATANTDGSWDFDGTIVAYEWRWGDNTGVSKHKSVSHTYAKPGTYLVRLTVTDNEGAQTSKQVWVTVN